MDPSQNRLGRRRRPSSQTGLPRARPNVQRGQSRHPPSPCTFIHPRLQLPIVAHVPVPYPDDTQLSRSFFAYDTRTSTHHPLRHAALDVIRQIAAYRATIKKEDAAENGAQYLLTGLTLFITHEPCLMCTMALLHSRVKEVFYLVPMPHTGGCGGVACVPSLKGVNHRFSIAIWKQDTGDWPGPLDRQIDV